MCMNDNQGRVYQYSKLQDPRGRGSCAKFWLYTSKSTSDNTLLLHFRAGIRHPLEWGVGGGGGGQNFLQFPVSLSYRCHISYLVKICPVILEKILTEDGVQPAVI